MTRSDKIKRVSVIARKYRIYARNPEKYLRDLKYSAVIGRKGHVLIVDKSNRSIIFTLKKMSARQIVARFRNQLPARIEGLRQ